MYNNRISGDRKYRILKKTFSEEEFISAEKKVIYLNSSRISFDRKFTESIYVDRFIIPERIYFAWEELIL